MNDKVIPREYAGMARLFLQKLDAADMIHDKGLARVMAKLDKRTNKPPRQEDLVTAINAWRKLDDNFRISFEVATKYSETKVDEFRFMLGRDKAPDWKEQEQNILTSKVSLLSSKKQYRFRYDHFISFGFHAIARRYQRSLDRNFDSIIYDLSCIGVTTKGEYIEIDTPTGSWYGKMQMVHNSFTDETKPCACIRTWISNEMKRT